MTQAVGHIARIPSKSHLTRRAALTGMALLAAPSTALAVCALPTSEDPIYEAIAAYKSGYAFHLDCLRKADKIEQAMWDDYHELCSLIDAAPAMVEALRCKIKVDGKGTTENAVAMLKAAARERAENAADMPECYRLRTEGSYAECDAMDAMLATVPTTRAGALALVELVLGDVEGEMTTLGDMFAQDDIVTTFLRTMASFLRLQA